MPKGLHALADIPYAANPASSADFLVLMPQTGPETFFQGISRVEPGHVCIVDRNGLRSQPYWRPLLDPMRMNGCALVIANPTAGLEAPLREACEWVVAALGEAGGLARLWRLGGA